MRVPRILWLYHLREIILYGALAFTAICTVMVSQNLLRALDDLVAVGFSFSDLRAVLGCLIPMLTAYAVPISFLFGVLAAMGRFSSDGEITAMRACGVRLRHLVAPALLLSLAVSALTAHLMIRVEHQARRELRVVLSGVAARGGFLEPGHFRGIGPRVIYVSHRHRENLLEGVVVSDRSDPNRPFLVFSEFGQFTLDERTGQFELRLQNGDLHLQPQSTHGDRYRRISFLSLKYAFDVSPLLAPSISRVRPREMSLTELREALARAAAGESLGHLRERDPVRYREQIHRRFALPVAPVLFALIGVPLGLTRARSTRSWGMVIAFVLAFSYYLLLTFGQFLLREGYLAVSVALWMPNALFALAGIGLLLRARRGGA